jgi:hypothetical protein
MHTNEGVEHEKFRLQQDDRGGQRLSIVVAVEPERRHGDEVDVEVFEVGAGNGGNALEAPAHHKGIVLGGEQPSGYGAEVRGRTGRPIPCKCRPYARTDD